MVRNATLGLYQVLIMDDKKTGASYHMIYDTLNASVTYSAISILFYVNSLIRMPLARIGGGSS